MVKIKKGLSDADMLKGFSEELTFEMVCMRMKRISKAN